MNIILDHVSKRIRETEVLSDINLHLEGGTIYGLRGINGSGKTMLLRMIGGMIRPSEGRVSVNGRILGKEMEFPESMGFLIENPAFLEDFTAEENLQMLASLKHQIGREEIRQIIERVGLTPHREKKYKKYSLGMRQRLGIAAALMESPELLMLDEPTNALDTDGIQMVEKEIRGHLNDERIILIASHEAEFLNQVADVVFEMKEGKIV